MRSTAFGICVIQLWFRIEAKLSHQFQLGQDVPLKVNMKESRRDVGIILDETEIITVAFANHSLCLHCGLYRRWEVENVDFLGAIGVSKVIACLSCEVGPMAKKN